MAEWARMNPADYTSKSSAYAGGFASARDALLSDAAIEAAAEALFDESQELGQENSWDDEWRENWRYMARTVIEAAWEEVTRSADSGEDAGHG